MLAEAERDLGRSDPAIAARAKNHELAALDAAGANDSLPWLFEKHYPRRGLAANQWWEILLTGRADDPGAKETALGTLDALLNGRLTHPQWEQALAEAHEEAAGRPLDAPRRIRRLQLAIDSLQSAGQEQLAAAEFEKLADLYSWAQTVRREDYLYGAEWHLKHGEPLRALSLYDECAARHGGSSDLFWLRGYALEQSGDRAHGAELMDQARQLTLGDERRMALLADAMAAHGHGEDAIAVRRAILRLGQPRGWTWYDECKNLGNALARAGQSAAAADDWQLFAFQVPDNGGAYTEELAYIQLPQIVRRHRARGLYEAGELPGAMAELRAYLAIAPTDINLVISAVPELKKLGHDGAARELFGLIFGKLDALCREYPDSAYFNNELAWLALRCDYEPAAAFAHASRAVELEPRDTNAIDTLAEACFRRGDRDRAVQLMKRCQELEPAQPRHAQRREQFEKGTPSSQPTTRPAAE
jgi:tetratricopeptide (TPR) repeat protein